MYYATLRIWNAFLSKRSPVFIEIAAYGGLALVGLLTWENPSFAIFYVFPVVFYAWYGKGYHYRNVLFSLLAAGTWLAADLKVGYQVIHSLFPFWNALIRVGIFITVFLLFTIIREDRAKLEDQNEKLIELNDQKNEFLGMAAHDVRSSIVVIQLYAEILMQRKNNHLSEAQRDFISRIDRQSKFMMYLLDDLLDFSKIEAGKMELQPRQGDYGRFVADCLDSLRILAEAKDIALRLHIRDGLPQISFDENKMEQVLSNLVGNAIKYSASGTSIAIDVSPDDGKVVTSITDQGQGIPADQIKRLFNPFETTEVKPTAEERRTGLGLAIAKKIVEGHGGEIGVDSRVGLGTTFFFKLPYNHF